MYNLLMTAGSGNWNNPTWAMSSDRLFEHTDNALVERFKQMDDVARTATLVGLPTLFAYEHFVQEPARVGRISSVQYRDREIQVTFALDPAVPPIAPPLMESLYPALGILGFEKHRTHWAVKSIDLPSVLRTAGIIPTPMLRPQARPPKVFISYSWDSPEHNQWVAGLATLLRQKGIDAILDQWHVQPGEDVGLFMERSVRESDRVLVICTESYVDRARKRKGGVGYEHGMVTGELMRNVETSKFIPVVRQSIDPPELPTEFGSRLYVDLRDSAAFSDNLEALVQTLHNVPRPIPPIGPNPFI
jgi:hypothetical protein